MAKDPNADIRREITCSGLKYWQIAQYGLGITDGSFSRKLRKELSPQEKEKIRAIITELTEGEDGE